MKSLTAYQKIVNSHLLDVLSDGRQVLSVDRIWCHEITTPPGVEHLKAMGLDIVYDPNRVKAMIDHVLPATDTLTALQGKYMREWTSHHGIEFLDVGRGGICHAVIPESCWVLPGEIGIMGDSHTCTHGALGAFAAGVGTTVLANALLTGLVVMKPQKVIRVNFAGEMPPDVFAKDLILWLINLLTTAGATGAVLEFSGPIISHMSMDARMTMTNMAVEAGATCGMMPVDHRTADYLGGYDLEWDELNSDPDARYDSELTIDVSDLEPAIAVGSSPGNVVPVSEVEGERVDQVYLGSCTNGRIEDMRIAASIMEGEKIPNRVRCIVVPATAWVYQQAAAEGLLQIFSEAGCHVSGPTCGACLGMSCGVIAPDEVCVSTTNRNFPGRMGKGGQVYLVSPATAAMTAITGVITRPDPHLIAVRVHPVSQSSSTDWKNTPCEPVVFNDLLQGDSSSKAKPIGGAVFYCAANGKLIENVDTDQIIPARYLNVISIAGLGEHCLEDAPLPTEDRARLFSSKVLVAGANFGCGSSREHAPWALLGAGITAVIAPSFARIFEQNMFENGLLCVKLPENKIAEILSDNPEQIMFDGPESDFANGAWVVWEAPGDTNNCQFELSEFEKQLYLRGGSTSVMLELAARLQQEGKTW